jgi:acetyltransferase-like isoleucine patch superfamily enzyme
MGRIYIGDYTQISANVGLITANHDVYDSTRHEVGEIRIGRYCWLGMNAVVLPGVELGDHTVVGAGSVVTSSFAEGYCVIAGNPAKKIRDLDRQRVVPFECVHKYNGYIRSEDFESYRKEFLNI